MCDMADNTIARSGAMFQAMTSDRSGRIGDNNEIMNEKWKYEIGESQNESNEVTRILNYRHGYHRQG